MRSTIIAIASDADRIFTIIAEEVNMEETYRYLVQRGVAQPDKSVQQLEIEYETVCKQRNHALLLFNIRHDGVKTNGVALRRTIAEALSKEALKCLDNQWSPFALGLDVDASLAQGMDIGCAVQRVVTVANSMAAAVKEVEA